jgi:hypothetical protein
MFPHFPEKTYDRVCRDAWEGLDVITELREVDAAP